MVLSAIMDHSALLFMVKISSPGTHTEARGKHSLISQKLTIFSDMELKAIRGQCHDGSRINLYYSRSTARLVIRQCAEYAGLRECVL